MAKRDRWAERQRGVAKRALAWATAEYERVLPKWARYKPATLRWAQSIPRAEMISAIAGRRSSVLIERAFIGSEMTRRSGY